MNYASYINSSAWRTGFARQGELRLSGFRCRTCNVGRDEIELQVHHRTYQRLGHELVGDLTTLCSECHRAITAVIRRRRYSGREPLFADVAFANCAVPLFDPTSRGHWS